MQLAKPDPRNRKKFLGSSILAIVAVPLLLAGATPLSRTAGTLPHDIMASGEPLVPAATAVVNFTDLANAAKLGTSSAPPVRPWVLPDANEEPEEPTGVPLNSVQPATPLAATPHPGLLLASPAPTNNYKGLDDVPMADSNYIVIPPDVGGGVGPTKVMEGFNNNYRIRDKATGVTQLTVGTATFWAAVTLGNERNGLTDPRTTYDPYNNRWIVCMQTTTSNAVVLVGVSQTSDPAGAWYLYRFAGLSGSAGGNYLLDFPTLGFNKNWVVVDINRYTSAGSFSYGICLALNYPQLRTGIGSGTLFSLTSGGGATHFVTSPAVTYSATEDSLFLVIHLGSAAATYAVDVITGTPAAPVYNLAAAANVRPGGGWTQPSGNIEPQAAPLSGTSACGVTPCKIEASDAQVRAAPVYRNGFIWYAQTIGIPAGGLTHTSAQWTEITPSTTPAFVDGARLDDPTATATNGGKWYDHVSLSVNANNDMILGFTQFSSAQYPSTGYAMHLGGDAPGTIRDAFIYKAGEDYYHKTFTTATGRNRWGDFSTCQVDPCDDLTLWTLQEYSKTRATTDDGNTGSNASKWSSWWAAIGAPQPAASVTCPSDQIAPPGGSVSYAYRVTNTGSTTSTFDYSVTDLAGWGGGSGTTPPLAPASFFDVFITFNIPANCSPPSDVVTFSAQPTAPAGCYAPVMCSMRINCDFATPTLVSRFDAVADAAGVDLTWWSDAVGQIDSWNVYRSPSDDGAWTRVNSSPIPMRVAGEFHLHDAAAISGQAVYRLGAMYKGTEQMLSTTRISASGEAFSFTVVGSNPFSNSTRLRYAVPKAEHVRVDVYSITGERVRTLVDRSEAPGVHMVDFTLAGGARPLSPGVYMARITAGTDRRTLRLIGMQ
jgi:hypothetical protein